MKTLLVALVAYASTAAARPNDRISILVTLPDRADVTAFREPDRHVRRSRMVAALQAQAVRTQEPLRRWLRARGATGVRPLWIINAVAATVTPAMLRDLLRWRGLTRVALDPTVRVPASAPAAPSPPAWNLQAIGAPALWAAGVDGSGVVVANMDTGVDLAHPDLKAKWRGGTDSWWDPHKHTTSPYDAIGHGTGTMGIVTGVAPGAQWIAAKIYDDTGKTTVSVIHEAFQWLLAPSGDPAAPDAPDVVNASWGLEAVNGCDTTFQRDVDALRAAGIAVVFAAGNSGPNAWTSLSPANNPSGFSAGAVDETTSIGSFSSRGASSCTNGVFPDVVAPGVNVMTTAISLGGVAQYAYVSGTSFSAPHVAGVAALLAGAFPQAAVADLEAALRSTAIDLGPVGPDDTYGYGLVDAYAAYGACSQ